MENGYLILAVTGASGVYAAARLIDKSPWPVALVASRWGQEVFADEVGDFEHLKIKAAEIYENGDLRAPIASGSVPTHGMVVLPCSSHTLAKIAAGLGDTLIGRAAHCHLKEQRPLVLCLRETPLSRIDIENALRVTAAGGMVMPLSPPFFMFRGRPPEKVSMNDLMDAFVDRVLAVFGNAAGRTWEHVR